MNDENIVHTEVLHGCTISIFRDDYPMNPRENTNVSMILCLHKKYKIGDKHDYRADDFKGWDGFKKKIMKDHDAVAVLSVYAYDHGNITLSTEPFSCPWDSGQVGFIIAPRQNVIDCCGEGQLQDLKKVEEMLKSELKEYDDFCRGNAFGFNVTNSLGEVIEEVGSYIGDYDAEFGPLWEARNVVNNHVKATGVQTSLFEEAMT